MENINKLSSQFSRASRLLSRGGWRRVSLEFDDAQREFEAAWDKVQKEFSEKPQEAEVASQKLIAAQPLATALILAIARSDSTELFGQFKRFLEAILKETEKLSGYPAVRGIPHVQAGFLYMAASVMALNWEAWGVFEKLLTTKIEWYYQSGRAIFSYPFDIPYFFHSEAFGRNATKIHDFYRKELARSEFVPVTGLKGESVTDAYVQAQMLMSLKVAQLHEKGESVSIWPDFGRFYGVRVLNLIDRMYSNPEFGAGLLRAFGEDKQTFFLHLNSRLQIIQSEFFKGAPFFYESLSSWEPRETHV